MRPGGVGGHVGQAVGVVGVVGAQHLAALDAESAGDQQRLALDLLGHLQDALDLVWGQEVSEPHRIPIGGRAGMVFGEASFNVGAHAAVDAADALHDPHRVPVQVVVDQAGGVLKVEALGTLVAPAARFLVTSARSSLRIGV